MKLKTSDVANIWNLLHVMILNSMKDKHMESIKGGEFEMTMQVNGIDLNPVEFFTGLEKDHERMVAEAAQKMVKEKFSETMDSLHNMQQATERHMKQMLRDSGIEFDNE